MTDGRDGSGVVASAASVGEGGEVGRGGGEVGRGGGEVGRGGEQSAVVLAISNRAAAGVYEDTTGPHIVAALEDHGIPDVVLRVVPDGEAVYDALTAAVAEGADVVVTTGGTGLSPPTRLPR
ncbi:MAG: molybdopterin-binding protein [Nocardioidaceae bacterium]